MNDTVPTSPTRGGLTLNLTLGERATAEWSPRLGEVIVELGSGIRMFLDPAGARQLASQLDKAADRSVVKGGGRS